MKKICTVAALVGTLLLMSAPAHAAKPRRYTPPCRWGEVVVIYKGTVSSCPVRVIHK
jgi:hypothetical protein